MSVWDVSNSTAASDRVSGSTEQARARADWATERGHQILPTNTRQETGILEELGILPRLAVMGDVLQDREANGRTTDVGTMVIRQGNGFVTIRHQVIPPAPRQQQPGHPSDR